jgi:hypothetical protein
VRPSEKQSGDDHRSGFHVVHFGCARENSGGHEKQSHSAEIKHLRIAVQTVSHPQRDRGDREHDDGDDPVKRLMRK